MVGLLYVVFGKEYDLLASHCIAYSRKYTKLPIQVLTNINDRNEKWKEIDNIEFSYFDASDKDNRFYKTNMHYFSKFENTIYLDADSIIKNDNFDHQIRVLFEQNYDLILNYYTTYPNKDSLFQNIYLNCYNMFNCSGNLDIYNGAIIGFKKSKAIEEFFHYWYTYWYQFGKTREMPPLACAINKTNISINRLPKLFFSPDSWSDCTAQHNSNTKEFWDAIGLTHFETPITPYGVNDYKFTKI